MLKTFSVGKKKKKHPLNSSRKYRNPTGDDVTTNILSPRDFLRWKRKNGSSGLADVSTSDSAIWANGHMYGGAELVHMIGTWRVGGEGHPTWAVLGRNRFVLLLFFWKRQKRLSPFLDQPEVGAPTGPTWLSFCFDECHVRQVMAFAEQLWGVGPPSPAWPATMGRGS